MLFVLQKYACSVDFWIYTHRCTEISLTANRSGENKTCGGCLNMNMNIDTNKVLEHFFDFSQPQEISDVLTGHGYKIFIPFPFLTFFPIPSDLNPIFPGQKQANPSSHFTPSGPSLYHVLLYHSILTLNFLNQLSDFVIVFAHKRIH